MELSLFIQEVYRDLPLYFGIFCLFLLSYYFLFKKLFFNIIDSYFIEFLTSAGSACTVFIMYMNGAIAPKYLNSFVSAEIALFVGIYIMSRYNGSKLMKEQIAGYHIDIEQVIESKKHQIQLMYNIAFVLFLVINILSLYTVGFVLLSDEKGINHVNAYEGNGFLLLLKLSITPLFMTIFFVKYKVLNRLYYFDYFVIILVLIFTTLSGSKSSFLVLIVAFSCVDFYFSKLRNIPRTRIPVKYILIFVASILVILSVGQFERGSEKAGYLKVFDRLLFSGDVFLLGYNDRIARYLQEEINVIGYILYPLYGKFLRLFGIDMTPTNIGVALYDFTYGIKTSGSNPRHNYLAYLFGGEYFSWVYSFFVGLFVGYCRFVYLFKITLKNIYKTCFGLLIIMESAACITDTYLFNAKLFVYIFLFLIIYFLAESYRIVTRNVAKSI